MVAAIVAHRAGTSVPREWATTVHPGICDAAAAEALLLQRPDAEPGEGRGELAAFVHHAAWGELTQLIARVMGATLRRRGDEVATYSPLTLSAPDTPVTYCAAGGDDPRIPPQR